MTNLFTLAFLVVSAVAMQTGDTDKPVSPAEAIKQIGKPRIVVEMTVKKAKERFEKRGILFLDSEEDFKDPNNLGVALSAEVGQKLKEKGIADLEAYFQGKRIRVRGCVMRFEERPYLPVLDPAQITVIENK
ncbi:MAG: hypothetical protein QM703_07940 [Gemmatales bacterium]